MKKMTAFIIVLVVLGLAALYAARQRRDRTKDSVPSAKSAAPQPLHSSPMDAFQAGVKLDLRTDATSDTDAKRRLRERLQQEEARQRPQEGRN